MVRPFASQADTAEKRITFSRVSEHAYAFTAEGDPNTGVIVGDDAVLVVDAQATPRTARLVIEHIRTVTDKPIEYLVLTSYHAVRTLGASAFEGGQVICSEATREAIVERGASEYKSAVQRFPRLFKAADLIPGLTTPGLTFGDRMSLWLGKLQVDIVQAGRGTTRGDTVVWLPGDRTLVSGDLVGVEAVSDGSDAHFRDWPPTLARLRELRPEALVPGRGAALVGEEPVLHAIDAAEAMAAELFRSVAANAAAGGSPKQAYDAALAALAPRHGKWALFHDLLPFSVARAYEEAKGLDHPRLWTVERDLEIWNALEPAE